MSNFKIEMFNQEAKPTDKHLSSPFIAESFQLSDITFSNIMCIFAGNHQDVF